jgi:ABC-type multidrug transport system permease subunit
MKAGTAPAIAVTAFSAWLGGVILFFGGGLLQVFLHQPLFPTFNHWIYFSFTTGPAIGALIGYFIYKQFREKE